MKFIIGFTLTFILFSALHWAIMTFGQAQFSWWTVAQIVFFSAIVGAIVNMGKK